MPKISIDLTTLSGWEGLSYGEHSITVKAKATGYRDSEPSQAVTVTKLHLYQITATLNHATADASNPITIEEGGTATLKYTAESGYALPDSVTVTGATGSWNKATGTLTLSNPTANVIFTVTAVQLFTITPTLSHVTAGTSNPTTIEAGKTATLTFTAANGYTLPDNVTVTGATGVWTKSTGTLVLSNPTANITFTITAIQVFTITATLTHCSADAGNPTQILAGGTAILQYTAADGYLFTDSVTVTGATSSWNKLTGTLTLSNPTGNVTLAIAATQVFTITPTLSHVTAGIANPTNILFGGTATLYYTAESGYVLPDSVVVTGATSSWDKSTGTLLLSNPTANITFTIAALLQQLDAPTGVEADGTIVSFNPVENATSYEVFADGASIGGVAVYALTPSVTNTTVDPSVAIVIEGGSQTFSVSADGTSYKLPTSITVAGTTVNAGSSQTITGKCTVLYTRTSDTSGSVAFSNVMDNVSFSVVGEEIQSGFNVTFSFNGYSDPGKMLISGDGVSAELFTGESETIVCPQGTLYVEASRGDVQNTTFSATGGVSAEELGEGQFILTITGDGTFDASWAGCFVEGTLITLADGSKKPVEDITYDDELLVWNFYEGKLDTAKPVWIMQEKRACEYNKLTFANGAELKLVGAGGNVGYHRIYNDDSKSFTHTGVPDTPIGCRTFTEDEEYTALLSQEVVHEDVKYYNIITDKHYNLFASGILTSCRLSNKFAIDDMKYVGEQLISDDEASEYFDRIKDSALPKA